MLIKRNHTLFLAFAGLTLLLAISAFTYQSARRYIDSSAWQVHSEEVIAIAHRVQIAAERAETAQRGFLITSEASFQKTYEVEFQKAETAFADLIELVSDNPNQAEAASDLLAMFRSRANYLQTNIDLVTQGKKEVMTERVRASQTQLVGKFREKFEEFLNIERGLLRQRTAQSKKDFREATQIAVIGLLTVFALLLIVTMLLRSESKRRQRAEHKAKEASFLKSQFLANMSHEIRTPLNGIIGMSKVLSSTSLTQQQTELLSTIQDSSNSLLALINQILDISKIESGKLQLEETHFDLKSLIASTRSIVDYSARSKGLKINILISDDVPTMNIGDPLRLRQVLLNLLNNAIKFSSKGVIELRVKKLYEKDSITRLSFEIIDEGVGIDKETQKKLFQSFSQGDVSTTRKFGGTGLGLSISKQLVELMDGKIGVDSKAGEGARFHFAISLKVSKYTPVEEATDAAFTKLLSAHVLVVEDNTINQKVAVAMLRQMGCTSEIAENGKIALEKLRTSQYDLILMDGQMPEMDGYEATREIRAGSAGESYKKIPIIAVTANATKGDLEGCLEAGMDDYVSKPIAQDDLHAKIAKWLEATSRSVDPEILGALRLLEHQGAVNLVNEVLGIFNSSAPRTIAEFRQLLTKKKFVELNKLAHHFKSTCMNVGAIRMRNILRSLELTTASDDPESVMKLIDALDREYKFVAEELAKNVAA